MKILVALSGGVDSSMTAKLLKDAGHEIVGCYMKLHDKPNYHEKNIEKVKSVGKFLGIQTHILDLTADFRREVFEPFLRTYKEGKTPNPCALCNRTMKFGKLLEFAHSLGCEKIATGHYAKIENGLIKIATDLSKDQSYFLANIEPSVISSIIFPLGDKLKSDVKKMAANYPELLEIAKSNESSEICFVENTYIEILREHYKTDEPGIVRNSKGEIVGKHGGYMNFTIGKRRGFEVFGAHDPHYVLKIDAIRNEIVVGEKFELEKTEFETQNFNAFLPLSEILNMSEIYAKIRYRSAKIACKIEIFRNGESLNSQILSGENFGSENFCGENSQNFAPENLSGENLQNLTAKITLKSPANGGIASGQLAVFYNENDCVIASGFIKY